MHEILSYDGEEDCGKNETSSFLMNARERVAARKPGGGQNLRVNCFEKEIQSL